MTFSVRPSAGTLQKKEDQRLRAEDFFAGLADFAAARRSIAAVSARK
jgi:hypothetical protein